MNTKLLIAATAALTTFVSPAHAQDGTGLHPYGGALIGWDHVVLKDSSGSGSKDGLAYGGVIGVDSSIGQNTRLGVEAEVMGASTSDSVYVDANNNGSLSARRDLYIGARAGVFAAPQLLAYVKAGYSNARVGLNAVVQGTTYSGATNLDGYRLGLGTEYGDKVRVRIEYRYSHYGNAHYQGQDLGVRAERHQALVGLIYGF